jgi:GGDEF domain-containing protein
MGAVELQIFVSLIIVLGAAFVALICDFLKGTNERLREANIELRVREHERERQIEYLQRAQGYAHEEPSPFLEEFTEEPETAGSQRQTESQDVAEWARELLARRKAEERRAAPPVAGPLTAPALASAATDRSYQPSPVVAAALEPEMPGDAPDLNLVTGTPGASGAEPPPIEIPMPVSVQPAPAESKKLRSILAEPSPEEAHALAMPAASPLPSPPAQPLALLPVEPAPVAAGPAPVMPLPVLAPETALPESAPFDPSAYEPPSVEFQAPLGLAPAADLAARLFEIAVTPIEPAVDSWLPNAALEAPQAAPPVIDIQAPLQVTGASGPAVLLRQTGPATPLAPPSKASSDLEVPPESAVVLSPSSADYVPVPVAAVGPAKAPHRWRLPLSALSPAVQPELPLPSSRLASPQTLPVPDAQLALTVAAQASPPVVRDLPLYPLPMEVDLHPPSCESASVEALPQSAVALEDVAPEEPVQNAIRIRVIDEAAVLPPSESLWLNSEPRLVVMPAAVLILPVSTGAVAGILAIGPIPLEMRSVLEPLPPVHFGLQEALPLSAGVLALPESKPQAGSPGTVQRGPLAWLAAEADTAFPPAPGLWEVSPRSSSVQALPQFELHDAALPNPRGLPLDWSAEGVPAIPQAALTPLPPSAEPEPVASEEFSTDLAPFVEFRVTAGRSPHFVRATGPVPIESALPVPDREPAMPPASLVPLALPAARGVVVKMPPPPPRPDALLSIPGGLQDATVLGRLVAQPEPFHGLVVSVSLFEFAKLVSEQGRATIDALVESVERSLLSLIRESDLLSRTAEDEFVFLFPRELGPSAQRRLTQISERLWDFQLRSLGTMSVFFSWGAAEAEREQLGALMHQAREQMLETRRTRRGAINLAPKPHRRTVNG